MPYFPLKFQVCKCDNCDNIFDLGNFVFDCIIWDGDGILLNFSKLLHPQCNFGVNFPKIKQLSIGNLDNNFV